MFYGDTKNKFIEPLPLISFVENAFKYGTDYKGAAHIKIKIFISEKQPWFLDWKYNWELYKRPWKFRNWISKHSKQIGFTYPNAHELTINQDNQFYRVHLNLKLDEIKTTVN